MISTQTPVSATNDLVFPTEDDIYDALMSDIEPELLSGNIATLDYEYPNESADEKKKRYARYAQAFALYDKAYEQWEKTFTEAVAQYRRIALKSAEEEDQNAEEAQLHTLETDMTTDHTSTLSHA